MDSKKSFNGEIDKVREINNKKQRSIADENADFVALACPGCLMTFDRNSQELGKEQPIDLTYLHISEILALLKGADAYEIVGVQYHSMFPDSLLEKLGIK